MAPACWLPWRGGQVPARSQPFFFCMAVTASHKSMYIDSGQRVWSETLDRNLDDVIAFVASTMGDAIGDEQAKAISQKPISDLDFREQMVRGIQLLHRVNREDDEASREIFEQVRKYDPSGLFPTLCLFWTYAIELTRGRPQSREDALEFSLNELRDLKRRHPRSAHAHRLMSRPLFYKGDYAQGMAHAERAYELNPITVT